MCIRDRADRKSRQMLHKAKKMNPDAIVVGAGCYVQTKEAEALLDDTVDVYKRQGEQRSESAVHDAGKRSACGRLSGETSGRSGSRCRS